MKAKFDIDADLIRRLAGLLEETGLSEIEIGEGERRVRVVRGGNSTAASTAQPAPEPAAPPSADEAPPGAIASPMVGTVYVAPEPGAPPFVQVGDNVAHGQTLLIIEAMKVMNPIRAPRDGRVTAIFVSNGDPVEFGESLLILE
ncbi:MAG: acetyl-CoA carboxylase biotin carboxyl carrier protein [Alphaproteobacteria bacterium]